MRIVMVCVPLMRWVQNRLQPAYVDEFMSSPHLGPYLLASILDLQGFDISMIDLACRKFIDETVTEAFESYDVVLLSCNSGNWPTGLQLIKWIKARYPNKIIVLGGIHATLFGEKLIELHPLIDYLIRGEGERSLPLLLRAIDGQGPLEGVPGLVCKNKEGFIKNSPADLQSPSELDSLPIPLYKEMPADKYDSLSIESSRGCKGSCTFCAIPFQAHWRPMSPKAFVDKIEELQPYFPKVKEKYITIVDDCFTIDRNRVFNIIEEIEKRGLDFNATYNARVRDLLDEALVSKLAPYTRGILVGAESFHPETLQKIRKPLNEAEIIQSAENVAKYNIAERTVFSFIIGFPWETKNQVKDNLNKIENLIIEYNINVFLQWHTLSPGSSIWKSYYEEGRITLSEMDEFGYFMDKKWFDLSSSLSIEERLDISDIVISLKRVNTFLKGGRGGGVLFVVPPYLARNPDLTKNWIAEYEEKMKSHP